ncbi:Reverse transcriptase (RNA-dependent DNA polymerase) [uncultured archaeon]|nr:Reverse transcriptase (RNA-dependent DNA polymerase) [uncultured archaeon]
MPLKSLNLNLAWKRVHVDSKKQFVPDLLYLKDYERDLKINLDNLKARLSSDFHPQAPMTIDQPKSNFSLRPGLAINIEDRIVYQALVDYIAPIIDPKLSDSVYSFRLSTKPNDQYFFKNQVHQWKFYREERRKCYVEEGYTYLLQTDITAFFEHISHTILIEKLEEFINDDEILKVLKAIIADWSGYIGLHGLGLPQNSAPSSFLSNFYLKYVDDMILSETLDCRYLRFADDISIFTRSKGDAKKILKVLVQILRVLHLNIQDKKTKIFDKTEIEELIDEKQDIIQAIDYGIEGDTIDPIKFDDLVKLFEETIKNADDFNKTHFNFCITRFKKINSDYAVDYLLEKLEDMPHSANIFVDYLTLFINDSNKIKNAISNFLANPETNIYEWQEMWFLIVLREAAALNKTQLNLVRRILKDRNKHWATRTFAFLALGKHGDESDREYIKTQYINEDNIFVKKAILIGCHKMNKKERNLFYETMVKEKYPELNRLVDYLKSKDGL